MKKISEEIFYKEVGFHELCPKDEEYQKRRKEYCDAYDALNDTLNSEQKKMLGEIFVCGGGVQGIMEYLYFKEGLRVGLRLGFEACGEQDTWED